VLADRLLAMTVMPVFNRHRKKLSVKPIAHFFKYVLKQTIVALDRELATIPPGIPMRVVQTSYPYASDDNPLSTDISSFIHAGAPPVYIGFGSMPDANPEKTLRMTISAVRQCGLRAVISRGWTGYSANGYNGTDIYFAAYEPHQRLFPLMRCVIHHGGAGTTCTAARAGVPQLTTPHVLDQFFWAKRTVETGIGLEPIAWNRLSSRRLAARFEQLEKNGSFALAARSLSETLRTRDGANEICGIIPKLAS